jgi:hypothetical protein
MSTGVDGWYNDSTGRAAPNGCDTTLASLVGKVIDVPVYDNTNGLTGNNGQYQIASYAPFFISGYYVNGGDSKPSVINGQSKCASGSASDSCIKGFFTKDLVPTTGTIGTGPSYGSVVVQMSG